MPQSLQLDTRPAAALLLPAVPAVPAAGRAQRRPQPPGRAAGAGAGRHHRPGGRLPALLLQQRGVVVGLPPIRLLLSAAPGCTLSPPPSVYPNACPCPPPPPQEFLVHLGEFPSPHHTLEQGGHLAGEGADFVIDRILGRSVGGGRGGRQSVE